MATVTARGLNAVDTGSAKLLLRGVNKTFQARGRTVEVLRGIDLAVKPGEFFVIVGPSGCGKSTLLRIVQGLEPPTSGTIELSGRPLAGPGPDRGFVFQQDNLYPWRTVMQNVLFGLELQGAPRRASRDRAQAMIDLVGLSGFETAYPNELSGGMRQRVNLARALAIDPEMLLMDEPFAALDALTRESMQQELLRVAAKAGKTVLFITHQIDEAVLLGDRVAVLAARPGHVLEIIDIDIPRPRSLETKRTRELQGYVDHIWHLVAENEPSSGED
jgi:NitT/TauT family transport system ATP-binding protein